VASFIVAAVVFKYWFNASYILAVMDGKEGDVGVGTVGKARNT